ncbi:D-alanyl-D-alanine carboxypeptidase family protein [Marinicella sp. W31]|uniref:D-alanyl-D-alanine carboxypeptidase family protein n=1 Tax=Marinicella sp. W31 TaxID=3023713 RepID=UPI003756C543
MQNSEAVLHSDRLAITIDQAHFLIRDRFDHTTLGDGSLDQSHFQINIQPQARNLGIATEACHLLFADYFKERPISASFSSDNSAAIALCKKLGFTPVSNARNTITASCQNKKHSNHHEQDLITEKLQALGISKDMTAHLSIHFRSCRLITTGDDMFSRPCRMHPTTWKAFEHMINAAYQDGIQLDVVSAYRDYAYQADLILNKLNKGQPIHDILQVNAPPGYSEHHSGRALDLSTPGFEPLSEAFEDSAAFNWLCNNAKQHGFRMSYPRDNMDGIIYEPWHWCYQSTLIENKHG